MSTPRPALVTQRGAQRLPRWALLGLCAAWIIPGFLARDPWRNADVTAFGIMSAMAEGRTDWLSPPWGACLWQVHPCRIGSGRSSSKP